MKFTTYSFAAAAFAAQHVAGHATFQALWIKSDTEIKANSKHSTTCVRLPQSNSPVENVLSTNIRCNANNGPVAGKCPVAAGSTVTVEMHQQPGDRTCASDAIGGAHWGPVIVYLSKVSDASTADGSSGWFKIFEDGWAKLPGSTQGDSDWWGVKDLNKCCGRMNVKIPADIPAGDYLMRAEVIALHAATSSGGAQFYMSCYQLTVSGGGSANPATVLFPGAYQASDPGIGLSIHGALTNYIVPGPAIYSGGSSKVAGASSCIGVETGTAPGAGPSSTTTAAQTTTRSTTLATTTRASSTTTPAGQSTTRTTTRASTTAAPTTTTAGGTTGGSPLYGQCGGNGWTGPTTCAQGRCVANNEWYSQCVP